jgi:hypothetical protein
MQFADLGVCEELLSPNLRGPLELLLSTIEPGASSGEEPYSLNRHEAGVVVQGTLELWVGERHVILEGGDSFTFASTQPHRCRNPEDRDQGRLGHHPFILLSGKERKPMASKPLCKYNVESRPTPNRSGGNRYAERLLHPEGWYAAGGVDIGHMRA